MPSDRGNVFSMAAKTEEIAPELDKASDNAVHQFNEPLDTVSASSGYNAGISEPDITPAHQPANHKFKVIAAFFTLYVLWGSTYLAIRWALDSFPPFLMSGFRMLLAGTLMYAWFRIRGGERPTLLHWRSAAIIGVLLLVGGNGGVVWAEQTMPSGVVSLAVSVMPIWVVLLDWFRPGGKAPSMAVGAGLVLGFVGVALLLGDLELGRKTIDWGSLIFLMASPLTWAAGSLYSRHAQLPKNPVQATSMQMLIGGACMLTIALSTGEFARFDPSKVTWAASASVLYLTIFGSIIGFSAFIWLLKVVSPARVATYAYVNPVVAVFLGWALAGEPLTARTLIAAAIILASVALIINRQSRSKSAVEQEELTEEIPGPGAGVCAPSVQRKA